MHIQFKGTNYDLADDMTGLTERKLQGLKKFLGKPEKPAQAYVDLGMLAEAHTNGDAWYAETNLDVDGTRFNAKSEAPTLRSAIEKMTKELGTELRGAKKKRETANRKAGGRFKDLLRFGR